MKPMNFISTSMLAALLLAGCASSKTQQEPRRLLLSYDGPAAQVSNATRPRLVVRAITIPDYLDRREMLRRVSDAEISRDPTALWAERPGKSITRWVTQALAATRPDYSLESFTTTDGRAPDAVLALTLDSFEPSADGVVRLRGSWIYAPNGKLASQSGRFDADAKTAGATAEASVVALKEALASAVKTLSAQLPPAVFAGDAKR